MRTRGMQRVLRIAGVCAVFGLGYLAGTIAHPTAEAQMGDLMKKAAESGGPLGTAAKLGTSIEEMQQHVAGLQKNIDTLNQIKAALGGG